MKTPFFITGLPRSRTAWLANLFTTDTTLCWHEPLEPISSLMAMAPEGRRIGVSDASLTSQFEALSNEFPSARWLYVQREEEAAMASLVRFIAPHVKTSPTGLKGYLKQHQACAARMKTDARVRVVRFEDLSDGAVMPGAWSWLLPEIRFPGQRWIMLCGLNVQQNRDAFRQRVAAKLEERK